MLKKIVILVFWVATGALATTTTMAKGIKSQGILKIAPTLVSWEVERSLVYQEKIYQVVDLGRTRQLQVVGLDDPLRPSVEAVFDFEASQVIDIIAFNQFVAIGIEGNPGEHAVLLVSLKNENAPKVVSRITVKTGIRRLAVVKKSLLIMNENVIMVYDISVPSRPQFASKTMEIRGGYIDLVVADRWIGVLHYPVGGQAKLLVYKLSGDELIKVAGETTNQFAEQLVAVSNFSEQQFVVIGASPLVGREKIYLDAYVIGPFGQTKPVTGLPQYHQKEVASIFATIENEPRIFLVTIEHHRQKGGGKIISSLQLHFLEYGAKQWQDVGQVKLAIDFFKIMQLSGRQLRVYGFDQLDQPVVEIFDF